MSGVDLCGEEMLPVNIRDAAMDTLDAIFSAMNLPANAWVSVALVTVDEMRELNGRFRQKPVPTDVLSFAPLAIDDAFGMDSHFGDIAICLDVARRQAREGGHTIREEIAVLFAHGLLHLLGVDHAISAEEAVRHASCEMTLLQTAGIRPDRALVGRNL